MVMMHSSKSAAERQFDIWNVKGSLNNLQLGLGKCYKSFPASTCLQFALSVPIKLKSQNLLTSWWTAQLRLKLSFRDWQRNQEQSYILCLSNSKESAITKWQSSDGLITSSQSEHHSGQMQYHIQDIFDGEFLNFFVCTDCRTGESISQLRPVKVKRHNQFY